MRLRRVILATGVVAGVFTAVLVLTFPTDALLRRAVEGLTPPGSPRLVFGRARLRPWGLRLEQVGLQRPDGSALVGADWLTLHPSLAGFAHDWSGRPWLALLGAWGGTLEATLDRDGGGDRVALAWSDIDLTRCLPLAAAGIRVSGLAEGRATVRRAPAPGEGHAIVRNATWQGASIYIPGVAVLHADPALVRWAFAGNRLTLTAIELTGPELRATGTGDVELGGRLADSPLRLDLEVASGPQAPPVLRDLVARLPRSPASPMTRLLHVRGTLGSPRPVEMP